MNKMVYENGFADRSIRFVLMIAYKGIDYYEDGLRREYVSDNVRNASKLVKPITEDSIPPIYSIRHPEDKKNSFIKDPSSRIWISEETYTEMTRLHGNIHIYLRPADPIGEDSILDTRYGYDNIYPFFTETFQSVMAELYKPYKEYYEKERKIGANKGCITGFDPAL
jgi:hypothetical protein